MILITGGAFQGKKAYAMEHFHLREQDMVNGADCGETDLLQAKAVTGSWHWLLWLSSSYSISGARECSRLSPS